MANKECIEYLLADIRELERQVSAMHELSMYPASSFSHSFELARKILTDLHALEADQVETLRRQMEEHRQLLEAIPVVQPVVTSQPVVPPAPEIPVEETETTVISAATTPVKEQHEPQTAPAEKDIPTEKKTTLFLSEILEKKHLSDFRKALSLNDRFRFRRELFQGDEAMLNKALDDLNNIHSYEESVTYVQTELKWNPEDESVADFIKLLEKRYL